MDDKPEVRRVVIDALSDDDGIQCEREFDSAEALLGALGNDTPPDLILTDVHMGGMNGVESLRFIRMLAPEVRVVVMTTLFDSIMAAEAKRYGASRFVLKVQELPDIARIIHTAALEPTIAERVGTTVANPRSEAGEAAPVSKPRLRMPGASLFRNFVGFWTRASAASDSCSFPE